MAKTCIKCEENRELSEFYKDKSQKTGVSSLCKFCCNERSRQWAKNNPDKQRERVLRWNRANPEKARATWRRAMAKRRDSPSGRVLDSLRSRLNQAVRDNTKAATTMRLTGCSTKELMAHLETQFTEGMMWSNYGEWHIDHIKPCSAFDFSKEEDQLEAFHYTNLQPLWESDNKRKGNR